MTPGCIPADINRYGKDSSEQCSGIIHSNIPTDTNQVHFSHIQSYMFFCDGFNLDANHGLYSLSTTFLDPRKGLKNLPPKNIVASSNLSKSSYHGSVTQKRQPMHHTFPCIRSRTLSSVPQLFITQIFYLECLAKHETSERTYRKSNISIPLTLLRCLQKT